MLSLVCHCGVNFHDISWRVGLQKFKEMDLKPDS